MVRAPTIAACPACRAKDDSSSKETGEPSLLGAQDHGAESFTNLPSRVALAMIPLSWMILMALVSTSEPWGSHPLGYVQTGWVSAAIAFFVGAGVCAAAYVPLRRFTSRIALSGQRANPLVLALALAAGLLPLVGRSVSRVIERANTEGLEHLPSEDAECTWTEARQFYARDTGGLTHVAVTASCVLPDGEPLTLDLDLDSATDVEGRHLRVPTWRGHYYGRLIAHDAYSVMGDDALHE